MTGAALRPGCGKGAGSLQGAAREGGRRVAATTSLWQPCSPVCVVVATMSLVADRRPGQIVTREAGGAEVSREDLVLAPESDTLRPSRRPDMMPLGLMAAVSATRSECDFSHAGTASTAVHRERRPRGRMPGVGNYVVVATMSSGVRRCGNDVVGRSAEARSDCDQRSRRGRGARRGSGAPCKVAALAR